MADPRALAAVDRIERALARIEAAARSAAPANPDEIERLRAAHETLRDRVRGAIAQVDRLIEAAEAR